MVECSRARESHGRMQKSQVESRGAMVECSRAKVDSQVESSRAMAECSRVK